MFKVICQRRHLRIFSLYETGEKKNIFLVAPGTRLSYLPQRLIHVLTPSWFRPTGKKKPFLAFMYEIFHQLGDIYFSELLVWKFFQETNIQNGWRKLEEKLISSVLF